MDKALRNEWAKVEVLVRKYDLREAGTHPGVYAIDEFIANKRIWRTWDMPMRRELRKAHLIVERFFA